MTPTSSRRHGAGVRLAGAIVGLFVGLVAGSVVWLTLYARSPRPATLLFFGLALLGLTLGLGRADVRVRHPKPHRQLDPEAFENRMIRRR